MCVFTPCFLGGPFWRGVMNAPRADAAARRGAQFVVAGTSAGSVVVWQAMGAPAGREHESEASLRGAVLTAPFQVPTPCRRLPPPPLSY